MGVIVTFEGSEEYFGDFHRIEFPDGNVCLVFDNPHALALAQRIAKLGDDD